MSTALYRALKAAGVDDELAREAARSVVTAEGAEALATKQDLSALKSDFAELRADFAELRAETKTDIAGMHAALKELSAKMEANDANLQSTLIKWNVGAMMFLTVVYSAIAAALRFVHP